jgi:ribosomal protein S27E
MSISVTCQACGADFRVSDRHAGKRFACRNCRAPLTVPDAPPEELGQEELGLADLDDERPAPPTRQSPQRASSSPMASSPQRPAPPRTAQAGSSPPTPARPTQPQPQGSPAPSPIEVACDGCGHRTKVGLEVAGRRVRCKKCGQIFRVPAAGGEGTPAANPDVAAFAATATRPARPPTVQTSAPNRAPPNPLRPPTAPRNVSMSLRHLPVEFSVAW